MCLALLSILVNSCTIEKRHYRIGYHIEFFQPARRPETVTSLAETSNRPDLNEPASGQSTLVANQRATGDSSIKSTVILPIQHLSTSAPTLVKKDTIIPDLAGPPTEPRSSNAAVKSKEGLKKIQETRIRGLKRIGVALLIAGALLFVLGYIISLSALTSAIVNGANPLRLSPLGGGLMNAGLVAFLFGLVSIILAAVSRAAIS